MDDAAVIRSRGTSKACQAHLGLMFVMLTQMESLIPIFGDATDFGVLCGDIDNVLLYAPLSSVPVGIVVFYVFCNRREALMFQRVAGECVAIVASFILSYAALSSIYFLQRNVTLVRGDVIQPTMFD